MTTRSMSRAVLWATAALLVLAAPSAGRAAEFPERVLKLVVPYPPGGATDILGRTLAEFLARDLKQAVIVENKPGANTMIGAESVARAAPDGYTMLVASGSSMVLNPLMYKRLAYDPPKDFRLVAIVTELPLLMVVHPSIPARTVSEFVAFAKTQGDRLNYASVGIGGPLHLAGELFNSVAGVNLIHVPYRGSAPALVDLLGGQVSVMFDPISTSLPHVQAGSLRVLGVGTAERASILPDVPTIAESGFPDYRASVWYGLALPRAVPDEVARRVKSAMDKVLADATFRGSLEKQGYVVQRPHDEAFVAKFLDEDRARWSAVIASKNISLD